MLRRAGETSTLSVPADGAAAGVAVSGVPGLAGAPQLRTVNTRSATARAMMNSHRTSGCLATMENSVNGDILTSPSAECAGETKRAPVRRSTSERYLKHITRDGYVRYSLFILQ